MVIVLLSGKLALCHHDSAEDLSSLVNVAPERSQEYHATIERAKSFISCNRAHIEELLLSVDIDSALDHLELVLETTLTSDVFEVVLHGEGANLLFYNLTVDDLGADEKIWTDMSLSVLQLEHQDQVIGLVILWKANSYIELANLILN